MNVSVEGGGRLESRGSRTAEDTQPALREKSRYRAKNEPAEVGAARRYAPRAESAPPVLIWADRTALVLGPYAPAWRDATPEAWSAYIKRMSGLWERWREVLIAVYADPEGEDLLWGQLAVDLQDAEALAQPGRRPEAAETPEPLASTSASF